MVFWWTWVVICCNLSTADCNSLANVSKETTWLMEKERFPCTCREITCVELWQASPNGYQYRSGSLISLKSLLQSVWTKNTVRRQSFKVTVTSVRCSLIYVLKPSYPAPTDVNSTNHQPIHDEHCGVFWGQPADSHPNGYRTNAAIFLSDWQNWS